MHEVDSISSPIPHEEPYMFYSRLYIKMDTMKATL